MTGAGALPPLLQEMELPTSRPNQADVLRIPLRRKFALLGAYAQERLARQMRAVAFITAYLALFQLFVLKAPIADFAQIAVGILAVIVGLALFMEGLFLAIMPLGERCGLRLPARVGLGALVAFAAVLGLTATYAEPAIGFLKAQGSATLPWRAPLLYYLLNDGVPLTVGAVAVGVGLAVTLGVFRSLRAWSLKPFLFVALPLLLALSWWAARDPRSAAIIGLAWDSGGVTTGPVTVPLLIALGVGVSRIAGRGDEPAGGLGVVTLASALPVLMVLLLGVALAPRFPLPGEARDFFAPARQAEAVRVVGGEAQLRELAAAHLSPADVAARFGAEPEAPPEPAGPRRFFPRTETRAHVLGAAKAVLPLAAVLLFVLLVVVRERLPHADELALGLAFSLAGMLLFSYGMDRGLSSLGNQAGRSLPRAWEATERPDKAVTYRGVDEALLVRAARPDGTVAEFLPLADKNGPEFVPFHRDRYDATAGEYRWIPEEGPVAGDEAFWGYFLVLAFVFVMGVGATIAEPSLNALGATLEELTTGTYKRSFLILTVALGVGTGMVMGFGRILFAWPIVPLLVGSYALALVLTWFSNEEFSAIAWDCAGVTTGPITVPLVIAAGLGIGQRAGVAEAFGVVTMGSVFPIIAVLLSGFLVAARRKSLELEEAPGHEPPLRRNAP
ncbi:MAG: DUF1538 domain-containing protein [Spartobacteria bacterium]|nr:DUF1538 domain-containing protein [Spartobacteria bacterium]